MPLAPLALPFPVADASQTLGARLSPAAAVSRPGWERLASEAVEPNGFFDPGVTMSIVATVSVLAAVDPLTDRLVALSPVSTAWAALRLPIPALVVRQPYLELSTPLLHRADPTAAAGGLLDAAAAAGCRVLVLPQAHLDGPAFAALSAAAAQRGLAPIIEDVIARAAFAAEGDGDAYLRDSLGAKKLKELRRQRHRLEDEGAVRFEVSVEPDAVAAAVERFLALEGQGWKGGRGTAMVQNADDAAFVRGLARDLSERGRFVVAELRRTDLAGVERTLAAGAVILQQDEALFFKIAFDETLARCSPGVQLTLDLTRWLAARPDVARVDSTAVADHSMIDHVWRQRKRIGVVYVPLRPRDPVAAGLIGLMRSRASARARLKTVYVRLKAMWEKRA